MKNIPFYKPNYIKDEYLQRVLKDDFAAVEALRDKLLAIHKGQKIVLANNQTQALHLLFRAMEIKRADKIICSVNAFVNIAQVIRYFDAEPLFVDIDASMNMDMALLERTLATHSSKKLKAICFNHVAGLAADCDALLALANKYNVKLINVAGPALGLKLKGFASCFNFAHREKEPVFNGSYLLMDDEGLHQRALLLKNYGINSSFDSAYEMQDLGLDCGLSSVDAALCMVRLGHLEDEIKQRQKIAALYQERLASCLHISLPEDKPGHLYTQFIVRVDKNRDSFAAALKDKGIETGLHFTPLHTLFYYKNKYGFKINDFPAALNNFAQVMSLPIYAGLSLKDAAYIADTICKVDADWI